MNAYSKVLACCIVTPSCIVVLLCLLSLSFYWSVLPYVNCSSSVYVTQVKGIALRTPYREIRAASGRGTRQLTVNPLYSTSNLRVRVQCRQIQFQMQIPRVGTKNVICLSVQVRIVVAGSLSQTVCRNDFLIPIGADFRNLNLPALYAYPMGRTACTEPQCLYKGELYLFYFFTTKNGPWTPEDEGDTFFRNVANNPAT